MFWFIKSTTSTVMFLLLYIFWITDLERNGASFIIIFCVVSGCAITGTVLGTIITRKTNFSANLQGYLKGFFIWVISTTILWIGFWKYAWDHFEWYWLLLIFFVIKAVIFYVGDYYADQILFQGGK